MHGESHLTFMVEWIRVVKVSLKSRSPRLFSSGHSTWTGRFFVKELAMMSQSIKENEGMRVMMAFQKYLPYLLSIFFNAFFKTVSFPSHPQMTLIICASISFSLRLSENVLALNAFFNQRITQNSFHPSLDIIKWLTDHIGLTASFYSPHPLLYLTQFHSVLHIAFS